MVSQSTLNFISWKILLKTCCLNCLMYKAWHNTMVGWAELNHSRRIRPYPNTDPVDKQLTQYIGLYDLNRKWSCFSCLRKLFWKFTQCAVYSDCLRWILYTFKLKKDDSDAIEIFLSFLTVTGCSRDRDWNFLIAIATDQNHANRPNDFLSTSLYFLLPIWPFYQSAGKFHCGFCILESNFSWFHFQ